MRAFSFEVLPYNHSNIEMPSILNGVTYLKLSHEVVELDAVSRSNPKLPTVFSELDEKNSCVIDVGIL